MARDPRGVLVYLLMLKANIMSAELQMGSQRMKLSIQTTCDRQYAVERFSVLDRRAMSLNRINGVGTGFTRMEITTT